MNTIDTSAALGATNPGSGNGGQNELGQEDYLTLMVAQIQNQDPFAPMENGQFVAELAQFSTVSGIEDLNQNFNSLAASISSDQTLQASGLIGRDVLLETSTGHLAQDGQLAGAVEVPVANATVTVEVRDAATGALVRRLPLGSQDSGLARFEWDGRNDTGERMPEGNYVFNAGVDAGSGNQAVPTLIQARVSSVSLSPANGGLTLNFPGIDALPLSQVREIS
jgi:flagellar basal-body rod modification protein FlgD